MVCVEAPISGGVMLAVAKVSADVLVGMVRVALSGASMAVGISSMSGCSAFAGSSRSGDGVELSVIHGSLHLSTVSIEEFSIDR
jgi:hypothetical protein